jgi:hypothetical protein
LWAFAAEEAALQIELKAPERTIVLEEPTICRTPDVTRLVLATAGTFVGTFALVLLAFAVPASRVRRIDPPAEE